MAINNLLTLHPSNPPTPQPLQTKIVSLYILVPPFLTIIYLIDEEIGFPSATVEGSTVYHVKTGTIFKFKEEFTAPLHSVSWPFSQSSGSYYYHIQQQTKDIGR